MQDHLSRQESFSGYRASHSFQSPKRAAMALEDLCGWLSDKQDDPFPAPFLSYLLDAYGEAAYQARNYPFPVLLKPEDTLEWLLTPIGAVLQWRSYDMDAWEGEFGDYDALALAASKTPVMTHQMAAKQLKWTGKALWEALTRLPAYLRCKEGVYQGVALYLEGTLPQEDPLWWPNFCLNKHEMGMTMVTF